jgi:hypothetical protein
MKNALFMLFSVASLASFSLNADNCAGGKCAAKQGFPQYNSNQYQDLSKQNQNQNQYNQNQNQNQYNPNQNNGNVNPNQVQNEAPDAHGNYTTDFQTTDNNDWTQNSSPSYTSSKPGSSYRWNSSHQTSDNTNPANQNPTTTTTTPNQGQYNYPNQPTSPSNYQSNQPNFQNTQPNFQNQTQNTNPNQPNYSVRVQNQGSANQSGNFGNQTRY